MKARISAKILVCVIAVFATAAAAFAATVVVQAWTAPKGSRLADDNFLLRAVRTKGSVDSASGAGSAGATENSGGAFARALSFLSKPPQSHDGAPQTKGKDSSLPHEPASAPLLAAGGPGASGAAGATSGGSHGSGADGDGNSGAHGSSDQVSSDNHAGSGPSLPPSPTPGSNSGNGGNSGNPELAMANIGSGTGGYGSGIYATGGTPTAPFTPNDSKSPTSTGGSTATTPPSSPSTPPSTPPVVTPISGGSSNSGPSSSTPPTGHTSPNTPPGGSSGQGSGSPSLPLVSAGHSGAPNIDGTPDDNGGTSGGNGGPSDPPGPSNPQTPPTQVPEPTGIALLGAGFASMLLLFGRRAKERRAAHKQGL